MNQSLKSKNQLRVELFMARAKQALKEQAPQAVVEDLNFWVLRT